MSQEDLADKLGVSRQAISKWEGMLSVPDLQNVLKISDLFNVSTGYLLKDSIVEESACAAGYVIGTFIPSGIGWFVLRFIFVVVFAAGAFILATCWTPEFKYYKSLAGRIFKAMLAKIKNLLHRGKKAVPAEGQESQDVVEGGAESVDSAESSPCAEERESGGDKSEEGK